MRISVIYGTLRVSCKRVVSVLSPLASNSCGGSQLIAFIDDLAKEMQGGGQTDVIVMDFSQAVDKVPHNGLL